MMSEEFDLDFRPKSYWGPQSASSCSREKTFSPPHTDTVAIAHVTLRSVMMERTSIMARRSGDRIYYSLDDPYMEQEPPERFVVRPLWAKKPLSMGQVISIIDENELIGGPRDLNFDGSNADEIFNFATASSEFYPELAAYFDHQNEKWLEEQIRQSSDDDDE